MKHHIDIESVKILKKAFDKWYQEERFYPPDFDIDAYEKGAQSAFDHIYKVLCRHNSLSHDVFIEKAIRTTLPNAPLTGPHAAPVQQLVGQSLTNEGKQP